MEHSIIKDLALILGTASLTAIISKLFRFPLILGYMLAGFLTGPYSKFLFAQVADPFSIDEWANLGVIFLLFTLGLEFDFKIFKSSGKTLGLLTILESLGTFLILYPIARYYFSWPHLQSVFISIAGSISSTSLILKSLQDRQFTENNFGKTVIGILVFEDIIAIFSLVLLSSLIQSRNITGTAIPTDNKGLILLSGLFTFVAFLIAWLTLGFTIIPKLINKLKSILTNEILVVLSLGLCLAMVVIAHQFGLSEGLGAFLTGLIFARTDLVSKSNHLMEPIRDLFLAVFFVSIGMMINIDQISPHIHTILFLSIGILLTKFFATFLGSILLRHNIMDSIGIGLSMTQIGEFSFLIAGLGISSKITGNEFNSIIVGCAVILSFISPILLKIYSYLRPKLKDQNWPYYRFTVKTNSKIKSHWQETVARIIINSVFIFIVNYLIIDILLDPLFDHINGSDHVFNILKLTLNFILFPFYWSLCFYTKAQDSASDFTLVLTKKQELRSNFKIILKFILGLALSLILLAQVFPTSIAAPGGIILITLLGTILYKPAQYIYIKIETWFISNFNI